MSLPALIAEHSERMPSKAAVVTATTTVSWSELDAQIRRTALALDAAGVSKGARVAAYVHDAITFTVLFMATLRLRAMFVPLPTNLAPESLHAVIDDCAPHLIVADADEMPVHTSRSMAYETLHDVTTGADLPPEQSERSDIATILYSSGTTSRPKGVIHTQGARYDSQLRFARRYGVKTETVTLVATPLYTSMTWASLLATVHCGGTTVVMSSFDADEFWRLSERHSATLTLLVPTQYAMLLERGRTSFERFDHLIVGGARTDQTLFEKLMNASQGKLIEQLGSTETEAICCLPEHAPRAKWGSVGVPLSGVIIKMIGHDDREVCPGELGEVAVHSSSLMSGYHGTTVEQPRFWVEPDTSVRYYRMGDLGQIDADGYVWIRGRSKELIITAGFNVYPADIEAVLLQHPAIRRAAVVGLPNKVLGEVPVAFAETRYPGATTEPEVCRWANARLSDRHRLYRVVLIEELPTNAAGKVLKTALRDLLDAVAPGSTPAQRR